MSLTVHGEQPLSVIMGDFNSIFPYLKLEFYRKIFNTEAAKHGTLPFPESRIINSCRMDKTDGIIQFSDEMAVIDFENKLLNEFDLTVQVFRKSGKVWLETSATDNWSLRMQNEKGRELSIEIK